MKWKKIAGGIAVILLLAVAFWYGGNTPDGRGFGSGGSTVVEQQADGQGTSTVDHASNKTQTKVGQAEQNTKKENSDAQVRTKDKSGNIFQQLIMKITHKGSSRSSKKGQGSKKAQRNAQKAVKKAEQEQKKQQSTKKKSTDKKAKADNGSKEQTTTAAKNDSSVKTDNRSDHTTEQTGSNDSKKEDKTVESDKTDSNNNTKTTEDKKQEPTTTEATTQVPENMVSCMISISCNTLLDHMDLLKENKKKFVPVDGSLLVMTTVTVKKGSTVFDVLQKVTKENKIQLEYNYTPAYKNYYIEGIGNLYEFDGGELSGWMYSVNGEFPGYGCSSYTVKEGDEIRWMYTCNLGKDVGGYFEE